MNRSFFLLIITLLLTLPVIAQTAYRHVTNATNTSAHITTLDHPQLNGNPNAMVFVAPSWEEQGDQNPVHTFGVWYNGTRWTIFNQNRAAMSATSGEHFRFKVLVFPAATANTFVHTVTTANKSAHITTLDHPSLNNNPNAVVLVTQLYGVYNPREIGVWYNGSRWTIFNQDRVELPANAKFNVLIATGGAGISGAKAIQHTHTDASKLGAPHPGYTILDNAAINNNGQFHVFATQRWIGVYHTRNYNIWYDDPSPSDPYHYRDGKWFIYDSQNLAMPNNAAFNILAVSTAQPPENPLANANVEIFNPNSANREVQEITTTLPFHTEPQQITVEVVDGYVIYQGDIILGREDAFFERQNGKLIPKTNDGIIQKDAGRPGDQFRWANGIVPFEIQANHPRQAQIREAIRLFNGSTNLCFTPRTNETDFIAFVIGDGCSSPIGMDPRARDARTGAFNIVVGNRCSVGNIQHEMLHTAGMYHEHTRSDRDNFVRIQWDNIQPARDIRSNFDRVPNTISTCQYDYGSIMHYPQFVNIAFAIDPTEPVFDIIGVLPAGVRVGQRDRLSDCDIRGVNALYPTATGCRPTVGSTGGSAVVAYELPNFQGRSVSFSNVGELRSSGFRIQSIRVPTGFWVALMDHAECLGDYFLVTRDVPDMSAQYIFCGALLATPRSTPSRNFEVTIRTGGDGIRSGSLAFAEILLRNGNTQTFPLNNGATWADNSTQTVPIRLPDNVQIRDIQTFTVRFESAGNDWIADNWKLDFLQFRYLSDQVPYPINLVRWAGTPAFEFKKNENKSKSTLINPY